MDQIKSNTVARILEEEKKNAESGTELKKISRTKKSQKNVWEKTDSSWSPLWNFRNCIKNSDSYI